MMDPQPDGRALLEQHVAVFRPLLELSPDPSVIYDLVGQVVYVNPAFTAVFGWESEELVGSRLNFVPEELKEQTAGALTALFTNGRATNFVTKRLTKDGRVLDVQSSAILLNNEEGPAFGSLVMIRDITAQKESERTLRASETRYREMLDNTPDAYYEVDLHGAITYYSSGLAEVLGYPEEELLGLSNRDYADAENAREIYEAFNQVYLTGQPAKAIRMHTIRKDGAPQILETSIALRHDAAGNVIGFRGIARDVTSLIIAREEARAASAQSEARYKEILETVKDGFYEVDLAGSFNFMNEQALAIFGYPREKFLGMNYREYTSPETAELVYRTFNRVFRTGEPIEGFTYPIITADGEERFVEVSTSLVRDGDGQPVGFRGIVRNVTDRIQAEEDLRQSEERYRTILQSIEDGYYETNLNGDFIFVNEQWAAIHGCSVAEMVGMSYKDYILPGNVDIIFAQFNQVYQSGEPRKSLVSRIVTKDGRHRHLELSVSLIRGVDGSPAGFRGVGRDATDRILAEEQVRESEERYRTILESIEDGYYETDLDGNFNFLNDQLCEVIGYPYEELMGKNYRDYTSPETAERVFATFNRVFKTGEPVKGFVWEAVGKDGRTRHLETFVLPRFSADGEIVGFRGVGRDITQRVQAEEALAEALVDQERIASQLATVAKVSTAVSTILDPQEMLQAVVDQVKESFNLYHAHVYLLNEAGDTLELVAGAGEVGRQMVQEGRAIPLATEQSLVARAARSRSGVIVNDVRKDPHFLPHRLLPDTCAEMAVPMVVGGQVLGVLDLQADSINRFSQRYVNIQTTLATQIAVALQNARFFARAQQQTAELQETSALLDQIIEILPVGLFMKEAKDLRFVRWNKSNEDIMGLKSGDVLGKNDHDFFAKEEADFFTSKDREVLDSGDMVDIAEEVITTPHRGQRLLHTRKLPILGTDGVPRYLLAVAEDITERRQAAQMLQDSLALQQTLHECSLELAQIETLEELYKQTVAFGHQRLNFDRIGLYLFDADKRRFTGTFGTDRDGNLVDERDNAFDISEEDYLAQFKDARQRVFVREDTDLYDTKQVVGRGWHLTVPLWQGGQFIGVLFADNLSNQLPLQPYEPDLLVTYGSTVANLIERKQTENELRESNARAQAILESVTTPMLISNVADGRILYANELLAELVAVPLADLLVQGTPDFYVRTEDRTAVVGQIRTVGSVTSYELELKRSNGEHFWALLSARLFNYQNAPAILTTLIDITERKQAQEVLRRNEQEVQESLRMQQVLHEVNLELSQAATLDELFRQVVYLGNKRLKLERFALNLYDEARDLFTGTYGIDRNGNLNDEYGPEFVTPIPDTVAYFRDGQQRIRIQEDCDLWDNAEEVVGKGWLVTTPLRQGNKLIGVLFTDNLISQEPLSPYLQDLLIAYGNIIVNLIERKRAEESIAVALAESEQLYEMSARLNAAASLNEILEAVVVPVTSEGLVSATLFTLEVDANGRPEWMEMVGVWAKPGSLFANIEFPIGSRFHLPELPTSSYWIDNPDELLLVDDVDHDERLDEATRGLYQMSNIKAGANLPLRVGNRWVGMISLSWDMPQVFTEDNTRIYHSLAGQTAVIMNNQLLFEQARKRAAELATVSEVGAAITTLRDVEALLQRVVDLTKERFDLYHVHIYLLDESEHYLLLTSGAGKVGRQMVAEGRAIPLNQVQSVIARAARLRQGIIVNDVVADANFLPHPLLPDTKSELAVPIIVADEVLGILDIQANRVNRFSTEDIQIQTTLAAQIGVALQNARSFARSETALKDLEEVTRRLRREGWETYGQISGRDSLRYGYDQKEVKAMTLTPVKKGRAGKQETPTTSTLTYPLQVQGEPIGQLMLAEPAALHDDAQDIMTAVAERLSAHIENLRLSEQTEQARRQAERLFRGSAALNTAQSYDDVLDALRANSIMGHESANNVSLNFYDQPWDAERKPVWVDVLTRWTRLPQEAVAPRYALADFPSANSLLNPDTPVIVENVANDPRLDENLRLLYKEQFQAKSTIFVPLVIGSQWIGYINAIFADKIQFPEDEIRRLTTLGQQAAVTIQSIRLYAQAESRAEELAILNEMVGELTTMLEVEPIFEALYRYSSRLMNTTNFYIAIHNRLTNEVTFPIAVEEGERVSWRARPFGNGMTEYLLRTGQALFVEDGLEKWLRSQGVESIGSPSQSWMGVPLRIGGDVVGVIALQSLQPRFYTREQFDLLNAVANQAVIAIQNARQFQQEQARAQRQQMLREIAAKVRGSADVDTIMRTAVQEIGQALGRQTFVYLGADQSETAHEDA